LLAKCAEAEQVTSEQLTFHIGEQVQNESHMPTGPYLELNILYLFGLVTEKFTTNT